MSGINSYDVRQYVIKPALMEADMWTQSAENLIVGIGLVETNFEYLKQIGNVPGGGLGIFQMQKLTHDDLVRYALGASGKANTILHVSNCYDFNSDSLVYNLIYATLMTRLFFARDPDPLPAAGDYQAMAELHKLKYNSPKGKTDLDVSIPLFKIACQGN